VCIYIYMMNKPENDKREIKKSQSTNNKDPSYSLPRFFFSFFNILLFFLSFFNLFWLYMNDSKIDDWYSSISLSLTDP
jgi:hypothetical protein